jgi:hypothetical protein
LTVELLNYPRSPTSGFLVVREKITLWLKSLVVKYLFFVANAHLLTCLHSMAWGTSGGL